MTQGKRIWVVLGIVASLSIGVWASDPWIVPYVAGDTAVWFFNNTIGAPITGLHIEFDQEVTIVNKVEVGGYLIALRPATGTVFDFAGGELVAEGTVQLDWQPADAVPTFAMWLSGEQAVGKPHFTTIAKLGYLFGQGIAHAREADPAGLAAAFAQFFADNEAYFIGLSESLGMSIQDSLMPIILSAPAEGIENFFNTIVGMLGVTSLDTLLEGDVNWGSLMALLGL